MKRSSALGRGLMFLTVLSAATLAALPASAVIKVGFLGQSILYLPRPQNHFHWVVEWSKGKAEPLQQASVTQGGAGLHSFVDGQGKIQGRVTGLIDGGLDFFVFCEGTAYPFGRGRGGEPSNTSRAGTELRAKALIDYARSKGAVPVMYIPYAHNPRQGNQELHKPEGVMALYTDMAAKLGVAFVPVAYAVGKAVEKFGNGFVYTDDVHVTAHTQFLTGCVDWATLTQTPPEQITYSGSMSGLTAARVPELIAICKETLTKYPPNPQLLTRKVQTPPARPDGGAMADGGDPQGAADAGPAGGAVGSAGAAGAADAGAAGAGGTSTTGSGGGSSSGGGGVTATGPRADAGTSPRPSPGAGASGAGGEPAGPDGEEAIGSGGGCAVAAAAADGSAAPVALGVAWLLLRGLRRRRRG